MKIKELRSVLTADEIALRVKSLGVDIDALYGSEPLVVVCVLKGASIFFADLVRALQKENVELDFVRLSSYGYSDASTRNVTFSKDVDISLDGKHVLIVEDIIDTGHSMQFLMGQFAARGAKSLRLAVLIDKYERREVEVVADFVGFRLEEGFLVGYGLDYAEKFRNLPEICQVIAE